MIVDQLLPRSTGALGLWLLVGLLVKFTFNKYGYGLNKVPGPWLAGFTDLYRLFIVWGRRPELWHIRLHKKHGKIVRLGPNTVSIADPEAIKIVYGLNSGYVKVGHCQQIIQDTTKLLTLNCSRTSTLFSRHWLAGARSSHSLTQLTSNSTPGFAEPFQMPML